MTDASATDAPASDAPATGASAADAPATDAPASDASAADASATDAPATGASAADASATDAPATGASATDAPATDASASDAPAPANIDPIAAAGKKARGRRPQFFELEESERLMGILMAVVGELAVTRERLDTVERLLEARGGLERSAIEAFCPDAKQARERALGHQEYIARVLRIVQQEREALEDAKSRD